MTSRTGISAVADTRGLSRLARDLRRAAPEAWRAYRLAARAAAQPTLKDARARASYSRRRDERNSRGIPASLRIRVTAGGNVKVVAGGARAPNAAPIENRGRGFVRHPVFGHRDRWTSKGSHPAFLAPAFDAHREAAVRVIEEAVTMAVEQALRGHS